MQPCVHEQAEALDKQIASHSADAIGPLAGVPIAIKVQKSRNRFHCHSIHKQNKW